MKRRILLMVTALLCAITCVCGLAACNDDGGKDVIGVRVASVEQPSEKKENFHIGNYVYGEDDKINENFTGLRFYKQLGNNTYEEIAESELTVEYKKDGETLSAKPQTYTASTYSTRSEYQYTYSLSGAPNTCTVTFGVDKAKSENFTVTLSKNTWKFGDSQAAVTVKNPAGTALRYNESGVLGKDDDSEYCNLQLFAMTKDEYARAGANAKSYSALTTLEDDENSPKYGYNKAFGDKLFTYYVDHSELTIKTGAYVLIACIDYTRNYKEIVCAAEFTVTAPDSPISQTFVLSDVTAFLDGGTAAQPNSKPAQAAAEMKTANLDKTVVCGADGKLSGTCDFGFGAFDSLTGEWALTLTFDADTAAVEVNGMMDLGDGSSQSINLNGAYFQKTLTLTLRQSTDDPTPVSYWLTLTFALREV